MHHLLQRLWKQWQSWIHELLHYPHFIYRRPTTHRRHVQISMLSRKIPTSLIRTSKYWQKLITNPRSRLNYNHPWRIIETETRNWGLVSTTVKTVEVIADYVRKLIVIYCYLHPSMEMPGQEEKIKWIESKAKQVMGEVLLETQYKRHYNLLNWFEVGSIIANRSELMRIKTAAIMIDDNCFLCFI